MLFYNHSRELLKQVYKAAGAGTLPQAFGGEPFYTLCKILRPGALYIKVNNAVGIYEIYLAFLC